MNGVSPSPGGSTGGAILLGCSVASNRRSRAARYSTYSSGNGVSVILPTVSLCAPGPGGRRSNCSTGFCAHQFVNVAFDGPPIDVRQSAAPVPRLLCANTVSELDYRVPQVKEFRFQELWVPASGSHLVVQVLRGGSHLLHPLPLRKKRPGHESAAEQQREGVARPLRLPWLRVIDLIDEPAEQRVDHRFSRRHRGMLLHVVIAVQPERAR